MQDVTYPKVPVPVIPRAPINSGRNARLLLISTFEMRKWPEFGTACFRVIISILLLPIQHLKKMICIPCGSQDNVSINAKWEMGSLSVYGCAHVERNLHYVYKIQVSHN